MGSKCLPKSIENRKVFLAILKPQKTNSGLQWSPYDIDGKIYRAFTCFLDMETLVLNWPEL